MNWKDIINSEKKEDYFKKLSHFIQEDMKKNTIYPPSDDIFNAFKLCPISDVKVVILGQDPYHGPNQAMGLSFSVPEKEVLPPSLKNIFKEMKSDLGGSPISGDLTSWAKQGVLLLNTILTVRANEPGSHKDKGWEIFTDKIINVVNQSESPIVFILWGAFARSKGKMIDSKHLKLESAHPSPLSAYNGFFGSKPFSKANKFLQDNNKDTIKWF